MTRSEERDKSRQLKKFGRKVSFAATVFIIVLFFLLLIARGVYNVTLNKVRTEVAYKVTREIYIEADGYAFRNETVIEPSSSGICTFNFNDGDRVSKGHPVVNVYSTSDQALKVEQIERLSESAKALRELQNASISTGTDPELLNKQIEESMFTLLGRLNKGNISDIDSMRDSLVYSMSKYNIVTNQETDFNREISAIEGKIKELQRGLSNDYRQINAPAAGYYVSTVDGYESVLKSADIKSLTVSEFEKKIAQKQAAASNTGKIVTEYDWYLVCVVNEDQAYDIRKKLGSNVGIVLPYTSEGKITASVVRVDNRAENDKALVVLKCSNMSKTLASFRHQKIKIVLNTYTGLLVDPKAIRTENGKYEAYVRNDQGVSELKQFDRQFRYVFVNSGNVTRKRYVEVSYEDMETGTAICRMVSNDYEMNMRDPVENRKRNYLDIYDEVIVEGVDLSDGKIVR